MFQKYLEKMTNLESHLLVLQDKNKLLDDIKDIELYLYPYKVIFANENVVFRALYEDIKENRGNYYIIILKNEDIQKAIIIGFEFFNQSTYKGFESLMLLSSSGEYKPFDKDSDGLILGEACSCVILENSKKADDDFEIVSYSNSFDNYSITSSNPNAVATFNCWLPLMLSHS